MMFEKKRLHPIAIVFIMFRSIRDLLFFFLIIFFTGNTNLFLLIVGVFLIGNFLYGLLSWSRFYYYVEDDALWIEYGILKRTKRSIAKNRIQAIDFTESIIHRPFKLTKVQIETASGGPKDEASLSAVTLSDALELRNMLTDKKDTEETAVEHTKNPTKKITFSKLLIAGVTSGGVGVILGFLGIVFTELEELIPDTVYNSTYEWIISASIIVIVLLILFLLAIVWLISVLWILLRYGKFTIKRMDQELLITRGLLERKQLTIPLHRIQAIGIEENLFRQPFGYFTLFAEVAGASADEELADSTVLFPLLHRTELDSFLETFVPDYDWQDESVQWKKPPRAAIPLYFIRSSLFILLVGIVLYFLFPAILWVLIIIVIFSLLFGWLAYKDTGFYQHGNRFLLRFRMLKRITILLKPNRIQAIEKNVHPLERIKNLASLRISILSNRGGKHYDIKNMKKEHIDDFTEVFRKNKKSQ